MDALHVLVASEPGRSSKEIMNPLRHALTGQKVCSFLSVRSLSTHRLLAGRGQRGGNDGGAGTRSDVGATEGGTQDWRIAFRNPEIPAPLTRVLAGVFVVQCRVKVTWTEARNTKTVTRV